MFMNSIKFQLAQKRTQLNECKKLLFHYTYMLIGAKHV